MRDEQVQLRVGVWPCLADALRQLARVRHGRNEQVADGDLLGLPREERVDVGNPP